MELLGSLPISPISPMERRQISSQIKAGIHEKLRAQTRAKRAEKRWKFISYALSGLSAAAAVVIVVGIISIDHTVKEEHQQEKIAGIEQATDRLSLYRDQSTSYDEALTNVQASINQLQMDGSTQVAGVDNKEMASVMDALMAQPMGDGYLESP
jgi:hypothetical protein